MGDSGMLGFDRRDQPTCFVVSSGTGKVECDGPKRRCRSRGIDERVRRDLDDLARPAIDLERCGRHILLTSGVEQAEMMLREIGLARRRAVDGDLAPKFLRDVLWPHAVKTAPKLEALVEHPVQGER